MKQQQTDTRGRWPHRNEWLRLGAFVSLLAMGSGAQAANCGTGPQITNNCTVPPNVLAITATVTGGGGGGHRH